MRPRPTVATLAKLRRQRTSSRVLSVVSIVCLVLVLLPLWPRATPPTRKQQSAADPATPRPTEFTTPLPLPETTSNATAAVITKRVPANANAFNDVKLKRSELSKRPAPESTFNDRSDSFATLKERRRYRRDVIVGEAQFAFRGLLRCANGGRMDELRPITCQGKIWGEGTDTSGLALTVIDSLDTLWLAGLDKELDVGLDLVRQLSFAADASLSVFEATIRMIGGLLSIYELLSEFGSHTPHRQAQSGNATTVKSNGSTKHEFLLARALDLGKRLMRGFDTPSGLPDGNVHLRDGNHSNPDWHITSVVLSEAGSLMLEFRTLTYHTEEKAFADKASFLNSFFTEHCPPSGLCPVMFDTVKMTSVAWDGERISVGGLGDSYYEYLLKQFVHSGGVDLPNAARFLRAAESINEFLVFRGHDGAMNTSNNSDQTTTGRGSSAASSSSSRPLARGQRWLVSSLSGGSKTYEMDHLSCFLGGLYRLAVATIPFNATPEVPGISGNMALAAQMSEIAAGIGRTCVDMYRWTSTGLAPEIVAVSPETLQFARANAGAPQPYLLRPEALETLYYLHYYDDNAQPRHERQPGNPNNRFGTEWEEAAWELFLSIRGNCHVEHGYSGVTDVFATTGSAVADENNNGGLEAPSSPHDDVQQSFFLAETLKYLLLIFTDADHPRALNLGEWVFNTEGHPLRIRPDLIDRVPL